MNAMGGAVSKNVGIAGSLEEALPLAFPEEALA